MLEWLLLGGKAAFGAVAVATGLRLARVARSGEGLGVHSLASAVIFVGGIGLAAAAAGPAFGDVSRGLALTLTLGGDALERLSLIGLCVFVANVFRGAASWPLPLTACIGAALGASLGWEVEVQPWPHYDATLPSAWVTQVTFALPFLWSAAEAGREWLLGRRRLALGFVPEIAVARFGLWAVACIGFVGICALAIAVPVAAEAGRVALANMCLAVRGALYFGVALAVWMGMFEPAFYARRFDVSTA